MDWDDQRWHELTSGYGDAYDPRPALRLAEQGTANPGWDGWGLLWENLHQQGVIGTASYAAVPEIVRVIVASPQASEKAYGLLARIEDCRLQGKGPALPAWLAGDYLEAWHRVLETASMHLRAPDDSRLATRIRAVVEHAERLASDGLKSPVDACP